MWFELHGFVSSPHMCGSDIFSLFMIFLRYEAWYTAKSEINIYFTDFLCQTFQPHFLVSTYRLSTIASLIVLSGSHIPVCFLKAEARIFFFISSTIFARNPLIVPSIFYFTRLRPINKWVPSKWLICQIEYTTSYNGMSWIHGFCSGCGFIK